MLPQDTVADIIARANVEDIPVAVHAIGDAAVAATLDAFAASPKRPSLLNRIEHAELVRPDDIKRFAPLGVAASMQPYHAISGSKYYSTRVGEARHEMAWSWREFLDSGANLTFGSDWPSDTGMTRLAIHTKLRDGVGIRHTQVVGLANPPCRQIDS